MSIEEAIFRFSWPAWYFNPRPSLTPLLEFESSTLHIESQSVPSHFVDEEAATEVATKSFLALAEEASFSLKSGWCLQANTIRRTVLRYVELIRCLVASNRFFSKSD